MEAYHTSGTSTGKVENESEPPSVGVLNCPNTLSPQQYTLWVVFVGAQRNVSTRLRRSVVGFSEAGGRRRRRGEVTGRRGPTRLTFSRDGRSNSPRNARVTVPASQCCIPPRSRWRLTSVFLQSKTREPQRQKGHLRLSLCAEEAYFTPQHLNASASGEERPPSALDADRKLLPEREVLLAHGEQHEFLEALFDRYGGPILARAQHLGGDLQIVREQETNAIHR
jgi:hypothetical protein